MMKFKRGDPLPRFPRGSLDSGNADVRMKLGHLLASSPYGGLALQRALAYLVRRSSFRQACCGLLSGGPIKSSVYLVKKMSKYWGRFGSGGTL